MEISLREHNQHQAHLSLNGRFNCMRGCFHVHTLIFQNDCLSISAPAYANQNLSFLHQAFTIEVSGRSVVSLPFIATAQSQMWWWVELNCCCCVRRSYCKIMLVLSVSEALDPCGLCLAPSFMGFEENWTISIAHKVTIISILYLKTLSTTESLTSAGNPQTPVESCTLVHKVECILGLFQTSSEASKMGYT